MTITILDGSMGQELVRRFGELNKPMWGIGVMAENPEIVRAIHDDYFAAGAEIATTNTYNIHRDRFVRDGVEEDFERLQTIACKLAAEARDAHGSGQVAGPMGPLGGSYRPDRGNEIDPAAEAFAEVARVQADYVDFYLIETMSSLDAARGAMRGAKVIVINPQHCEFFIDLYAHSVVKPQQWLVRRTTMVVGELQKMVWD